MIFAIVTVVILIIDQAVKYWINTSVPLGAVEEFIPGLINLTNYHNTGAAWGFMSDVDAARWIFVVLVFVLCALIIVLISKDTLKSRSGNWFMVLILAGGIGNCIDRLINGYVVDMFQFAFWESFPIFNVADIFITVGGIAFCIWIIVHKFPEPEKKVKAPMSTRGRSSARTATRVPTRTPSPKQEPPVDYISHLQLPVVEAKAAINNQRIEAENDPFSGLYSNSASAQRAEPRPKAPARPAQPARPTQQAQAPNRPTVTATQNVAPTPVKATAPAPKKSSDDFSLNDILAEFSDK